MPNYTDTLNLKLTDMETDGDELFLFDEDLNENFEKIDARFTPQTITVTTSDWDGTEAPYTQTVTVEGMTEDLNPHACLIYSDDYETAMTQRSDYSKIYKAETAENEITFYSTAQTSVDLTLQIKNL